MPGAVGLESKHQSRCGGGERETKRARRKARPSRKKWCQKGEAVMLWCRKEDQDDENSFDPSASGRNHRLILVDGQDNWNHDQDERCD